MVRRAATLGASSSLSVSESVVESDASSLDCGEEIEVFLAEFARLPYILVTFLPPERRSIKKTRWWFETKKRDDSFCPSTTISFRPRPLSTPRPSTRSTQPASTRMEHTSAAHPSPPGNVAAPTTTIHSLPVEILDQILSYRMRQPPWNEPLRFSPTPNAFSQLQRHASLVCRGWRPIAEGALCRDVYAQHPTDKPKLVRLPPKELYPVRSLWINLRTGGDIELLRIVN